MLTKFVKMDFLIIFNHILILYYILFSKTSRHDF
eukprot:UN23685